MCFKVILYNVLFENILSLSLSLTSVQSVERTRQMPPATTISTWKRMETVTRRAALKMETILVCSVVYYQHFIHWPKKYTNLCFWLFKELFKVCLNITSPNLWSTFLVILGVHPAELVLPVPDPHHRRRAARAHVDNPVSRVYVNCSRSLIDDRFPIAFDIWWYDRVFRTSQLVQFVVRFITSEYRVTHQVGPKIYKNTNLGTLYTIP